MSNLIDIRTTFKYTIVTGTIFLSKSASYTLLEDVDVNLTSNVVINNDVCIVALPLEIEVTKDNTQVNLVTASDLQSKYISVSDDGTEIRIKLDSNAQISSGTIRVTGNYLDFEWSESEYHYCDSQIFNIASYGITSKAYDANFKKEEINQSMLISPPKCLSDFIVGVVSPCTVMIGSRKYSIAKAFGVKIYNAVITSNCLNPKIITLPITKNRSLKDVRRSLIETATVNPFSNCKFVDEYFDATKSDGTEVQVKLCNGIKLISETVITYYGISIWEFDEEKLSLSVIKPDTTKFGFRNNYTTWTHTTSHQKEYDVCLEKILKLRQELFDDDQRMMALENNKRLNEQIDDLTSNILQLEDQKQCLLAQNRTLYIKNEELTNRIAEYEKMYDSKKLADMQAAIDTFFTRYSFFS